MSKKVHSKYRPMTQKSRGVFRKMYTDIWNMEYGIHSPSVDSGYSYEFGNIRDSHSSENNVIRNKVKMEKVVKIGEKTFNEIL